MFQIIKPNTNFDFIGNRHKFEIISAILLLSSIALVATKGLNWGIDFAGGYEFQVKFPKAVSAENVQKAVDKAGVGGVIVQSIGDTDGNEYLLRIEKHAGVDPKQVEAARGALKSDTLKEFSYNEEAPDRIRIVFTADPGAAVVQDAFTKQNLTVKTVQKSARDDRAEYTVSLKSVADAVDAALHKELGIAADVVIAERVDFVGPQVGKQLREQGLWAVLAAFGFMLLYIAFRFDFYFGPVAIRCLFYDTLVTIGAYALTGKEFNLTSIAALLTIVGYSMNDTIVIFDRIRENNVRMRGRELEGIVNSSLNETLSRTILQTAVTQLVVIAMWALGGGVLSDFGFALFVGFTVATFSSISISAPLYIFLRKKFDPSLAESKTVAPAAGR
ncbi:MAG: protein translocase subunit SecF [Deltaproteobacteria bacterium]|nr:protein translocase subunit SecF [Deltaproteobacteria bacterium]